MHVLPSHPNHEGRGLISNNLPVTEVFTASSSLPMEFGTPFSASKSSRIIGSPPSLADTGHFSSRLGYGLLNKTSQVGAAEEFLSHYFVAGPDSFALRLYKDTIILSLRILQGEISIPGFIPSLMRYRFRYEKSDYYVSDASDFLRQLSLHDMARSSPASTPETEGESGIILFGPSHPVMTSLLRATVYQDLAPEVGSVGEWLDSYNTQLYLQNHWGFKLTASTAKLDFRRRPYIQMGRCAVSLQLANSCLPTTSCPASLGRTRLVVRISSAQFYQLNSLQTV
jgi:hypothetical protein